MLVVQGTGFNWTAPDHLRLVFLPNSDDLTEALAHRASSAIVARTAHHRREVTSDR